MVNDLTLRLPPEIAYDPVQLKIHLSGVLDIDVNRICDVVVMKRSIDARQRKVFVNLSVKAYVDCQPTDDPVIPTPPIAYGSVAGATQVIIVGAGPAGLFAALRLIELGLCPILLERGKDVDSRRMDLAGISRKNAIDPDSNYCFGEGGAGAYSDGKLYTRSKKRGSVEKILTVFHQHGASRDIFVDVHPHIGTDRLPNIIRAIRQTIIGSGGQVHFSTKVTSLVIENNRVCGVECANGKSFDGCVILATGHSARDVYQMLENKEITIESKGLAVGVRIEHLQHTIDCIQYHSKGGRGRYLPPAEYTMLARVDNRAVYSFCMCPGGFIIPASSAPNQLVVNGMSPSSRGTRWANSGMVVEVLPEDLPEYDRFGNLKMMRFQEDIERRFFDDGDGSQNAPAQRMADFVVGKDSTTLPATSYAPGIHPARIDKLLPAMIAYRLQKGLKIFGTRYKGFLTNDAVLIGDETRTSSPVRIPRDKDTLMHVAVNGLFPCGEGAGYSGGIVSAAIDGERCAEAAYNYLTNLK